MASRRHPPHRRQGLGDGPALPVGHHQRRGGPPRRGLPGEPLPRGPLLGGHPVPRVALLPLLGELAKAVPLLPELPREDPVERPVAGDGVEPGDGGGLLGVVGRVVARPAGGEGHDGLGVLLLRPGRGGGGRDDDLGGEGGGVSGGGGVGRGLGRHSVPSSFVPPSDRLRPVPRLAPAVRLAPLQQEHFRGLFGEIAAPGAHVHHLAAAPSPSSGDRRSRGSRRRRRRRRRRGCDGGGDAAAGSVSLADFIRVLGRDVFAVPVDLFAECGSGWSGREKGREERSGVEGRRRLSSRLSRSTGRRTNRLPRLYLTCLNTRSQ